MNNQYEIKIFTNINDEELKNAWNEIYDEGNTFVQSSYYWLSSWWNVKNKNKDAYIITVISDNKIIGIAPFFYQNTFYVKGLHSFPIHFGDFISYITITEDRQNIIKLINQHLKTFTSWSFFKIDNVNEKDTLYTSLVKNNIKNKLMTTVSILNFDSDFETYLQSLSTNRRQKTKKYLRNLKKNHQVDFKVIDTYEDYMAIFQQMRQVYINRWGKDISEEIYKYINLALKEHFRRSEIKLFVLFVDNQLIGFHLSFSFKNYLYSWKESFISNYDKYSPGNLLRIYLIPEYLLNNGFKGINYMAGDYEYKRAQVGEKGFYLNNCQFVKGKGLMGKIVENYYLYYRDKIKNMRNKLQEVLK